MHVVPCCRPPGNAGVVTLARKIAPVLASVFTSPRTRDARRWLVEQRRRLSNDRHRVQYFHQADDPYSHLAAQVLHDLATRYDIRIEPYLVGPPPDAAAPDRQRLEWFSRKDAADIAPAYGLKFPPSAAFGDNAAPAAAPLLEQASRLLAGAIVTGRFVDVAASIGQALWDGDQRALEELAFTLPPSGATATRTAIEEGNALRERLGHYLGATFHYGGEWYWGVDRLEHLEQRLKAAGAARGKTARPIVARPDFSERLAVDGARRLTLEFYLSLRSPYTYIAMERVYALPGRYPVNLVLRPLLPMVMRGLPIPRAKRIYITLDTKREAEDIGVPFGRVCDPVGRPVERGFSLFPWARERGRAKEFLLSFARAAFAEGVDAGEDAGMQHVVEASGLSWAEARQHLDREGWRDELEQNRQQLLAMGLWGVPSFRLIGGGEPDFCTWGQDRLWLVEQQIRSRLL